MSLYLIVGDVGSAHARRYQAVTQNTMIVSSSSRQEGKEGGESAVRTEETKYRNLCPASPEG